MAKRYRVKCSKCGDTYTEAIPVWPPMIGDVNGDRIVNLKDVTMLKKYVANSVTRDDIVYTNSNVDGDTLVNVKDVNALKKRIAG